MKTLTKSIPFFVALTYVGMVAVNVMANALPINGIPTGQVSDNYANLFAPAGVTFAIWGLIYLLLGIYTVFQFGLLGKGWSAERRQLVTEVGIFFTLSSLANMAWIFAWHYDLLGLSVLLMLVILGCLIKIADIVAKSKLSKTDRWLIKLPFSVYFGWITVATIANITTFLVSIGWNGFGISEPVWTMIILVVGAVIGSWRMLKDKSFAYGLVLIWAYCGIWLKHTSPAGWTSQYPGVIGTIIVCLVGFILLEGWLLLRLRGKNLI